MGWALLGLVLLVAWSWLWLDAMFGDYDDLASMDQWDREQRAWFEVTE